MLACAERLRSACIPGHLILITGTCDVFKTFILLLVLFIKQLLVFFCFYLTSETTFNVIPDIVNASDSTANNSSPEVHYSYDVNKDFERNNLHDPIKR